MPNITLRQARSANMSRRWGLLLLCFLWGCAPTPPKPPPTPKASFEEKGLPLHCHPLVPDHCQSRTPAGKGVGLLPWPSSYFLKKDTTTETGYRLNYPQAAMPVPASTPDTTIDLGRFRLADGFSPGSQPIVYVKQGFSKEGLPTQATIADSVTEKSLIWLIAYKTGKRVPLFAEVDANAKDGEVGALIIRPQARLAFNSRYVIVLRKGLKGKDGKALVSPAPFQRLVEGAETENAALKPFVAQMKEVLAFLGEQQIDPKGVLVAWDFHTASETHITGRLKKMLADGMAKLAKGGPAVSDLKVADFNDPKVAPGILRSIKGMMEVPTFLDKKGTGARLVLDSAGLPQVQGMERYAFHVNIPRCAKNATGPLPVLVFGHGLFQDQEKKFGSDYHRNLQERLCMVGVGVNWLGAATADAFPIAVLLPPTYPNRLPETVDRLLQAHINLHALMALIQGAFASHDAMKIAGKLVTDGKEMYYFGVSNGAIQGTIFAALTKQIKRFVLHVGGGPWSLVLRRSSNYRAFSDGFKAGFPDPTDVTLVLALAQTLWDYDEPTNFAHYLRRSPLPGHEKKMVAIQESLNDEQVPNLSTRILARTAGVPAISPLVSAVYGLEEKSGPLEAAFMQWDIKATPVPLDNTPAAKPKDEDSAHKLVRTLDHFQTQMAGFFKPDGMLVYPCQTVCGRE